jgi:hypothetical protein
MRNLSNTKKLQAYQDTALVFGIVFIFGIICVLGVSFYGIGSLGFGYGFWGIRDNFYRIKG